MKGAEHFLLRSGHMTGFSRREFLKTGLVGGLSAALLPVGAVWAASKRIATNDSGVAIDGYDTTAYWRAARALSGNQRHKVMWQGTPWHFATAEDAAQFKTAPEKFAPKFGGFCTRALSFKKVVHGDPEVWRIYQGNLYLFAQPVGGRKFDQGQDAMIAKAQAYWDSLG